MSAVPKTTPGELLIPIVSEENQKRFPLFIKQSFELCKESKEILALLQKVLTYIINRIWGSTGLLDL